ncbi:MAG TPA: ABC transporter ATP-binding protein [Vicinamibacterales bacterium]|nr:ABC transporter ATP-binding protein [Vicinamibacterales bacterium]
MSDVMIECQSVWKKFSRRERHDTLRDLLPSLTRKMLSGRAKSELAAEEFWAVEDVSFSVVRGEAVAVIGRNGAGKSTLLKILNRILRPTRGTCQVRGRTGALIELASGFHPDLTGRENIFLQAAIMRMSRTEAQSKLDSIVDFAGVADFVDVPVKRYSSGMNARLGFSIAAHLEPDVLIIDEVLSVGDMAFQRRCIERMQEFKASGVAILFVSHDLAAVARLCDRTLLLNRSLIAAGPTADIVRLYAASGSHNETAAGADAALTIDGASYVGAATRSVAVAPGTPLTLRVSYSVHQPTRDLTFGLVLRKTDDQFVVYDANFTDEELGITAMTPGARFEIDFQLWAHLLRGHYDFECHVLHAPTQRFICRAGPLCAIVIEETRTFAGVADLNVTPSVRRLMPTA